MMPKVTSGELANKSACADRLTKWLHVSLLVHYFQVLCSRGITSAQHAASHLTGIRNFVEKVLMELHKEHSCRVRNNGGKSPFVRRFVEY